MSQFTVRIPWVSEKFQTPWHPTDKVGPFSTLTRGVFGSPEEAIRWGKDHLHGAPYSVEPIVFED